MRIFFRAFLVLAPALWLVGCGRSGGIEQTVEVPTGMVLIKGGTLQMGSEDGMPFEAPVHTVEISSFLIDEHEVTVAEFERFVNATGYRTEAERFGWSAVFDLKT